MERALWCVISADAAGGGFPRAALLLAPLVCLLFCGKSVSAKQCRRQAFPLVSEAVATATGIAPAQAGLSGSNDQSD